MTNEGNSFLTNLGELGYLHSNDNEEQEILDREKYLQYNGKNYNKYIKGINTHNQKYGLIGGHRWDVYNFFINMDEEKKNELIAYFEEQHSDLFNTLFQIGREDKIMGLFYKAIKANPKKMKEITGIYQKDLEFLFREKKINDIEGTLIYSAMKYDRKKNSDKINNTLENTAPKKRSLGKMNYPNVLIKERSDRAKESAKNIKNES